MQGAGWDGAHGRRKTDLAHLLVVALACLRDHHPLAVDLRILNLCCRVRPFRAYVVDVAVVGVPLCDGVSVCVILFRCVGGVRRDRAGVCL